MKKFLSILGIFIFSFFIFAFQAEAKSDWKDYFSRDEMKALKKAVKKSIVHDVEDKDDDWKGIISSSLLDDDVVLKKIYTGDFYDNTNDADVVVDTGNSDGDVYYYQEIAIEEIDLDDMPIVKMYTKEDETTYSNEFSGDIWEERDMSYFQDGKVYYRYYHTDDEGGNNSYIGDGTYKIVVMY